MPLSSLTSNYIAEKLNLETLQLEEKMSYIKNLVNKSDVLNKTKKLNNRFLFPIELCTNSEIKEDLIIYYIVSINFSRSNTSIEFSDTKGNCIFFFNSGNVNLEGRQKRQRKTAINRLIKLLTTKLNNIGNIPVAIHLRNVRTYKLLIVEKLQHHFFVRVIKSFEQVPYNGCRKRKIRRKKYIKRIKK